MNRFEAAENVIERMDVGYRHDETYYYGLRAVLAAAFTDDEPEEPRAFEIGFCRAGHPEDEPAWLVVNAVGESWVVYGETAENEARPTPGIWLVRPHPDAELRFEGSGRPRALFTHPDGSRIVFTWRRIRAFDDDEHGIRDVFKAWVGRR